MLLYVILYVVLYVVFVAGLFSVLYFTYSFFLTSPLSLDE